MKLLDKSPTYYRSLEMYAKLVNQGVKRSVTFEQVLGHGYDKAPAGKETFHIQEELAIVEKGVLRSLSAKAVKLCIEIMDELFMNNTLWYRKPKNTHESGAIKELRERNILMTTEEPFIHYVNPAFIRRGSRASVLAHTTEELSKVSRVSKELIRDFSFRKKIDFNGFDQIMSDTH